MLSPAAAAQTPTGVCSDDPSYEDELLSDINDLRAKYDHEDLTHAAFIGVLQIFLQEAAGG